MGFFFDKNRIQLHEIHKNLQLHYEKIYTIFFQKFQECKIRNYVQKSVLFQDFLCDSDCGANFGSS